MSYSRMMTRISVVVLAILCSALVAAADPAPGTPASAIKPKVIKPATTAPELDRTFGFQSGVSAAAIKPVVRVTRPAPRIVLPRETNLSTFQGFGGAYAKPKLQVRLTRPAPGIVAPRTCTSGSCTDEHGAAEEPVVEVETERVVSERIYLDDCAPRRPVDGYNPVDPDTAPYTKRYSVSWTPNCNSCSPCDTGSSCCSDRPAVRSCEPCRPRYVVRRVVRRPMYRPVVYARPAYGWGWGRPYWGGWGGWGGCGWGWGGCW